MNTSIQNTKNPLEYEKISKLLAKFAVPAVISMLVNALYNIVDQIFIGKGVGYLGNAATTVSFPIVTIVLAVGTLLGSGGGAYASIKMGEKKEKEAIKTLNNVFVLLTGIGLLFTILGTVFLTPILTVFGATSANMQYAKDYSFIIMLGIPFNMIGIGLSNLARTDGNPKFSMFSMLIGAFINTILDPIFIFVFGWGVTGAAIATVLSQIISALFLIYYFVKMGNMRLKLREFPLDVAICKSMVMLGLSSCITQIAATIVQIVMNQSLVFYGNMSSVGGDVALSAMGIVLKINMIVVSICIGIGVGSQPILGFNKGAKQFKRVKKTYQAAVKIAFAVTVVGWLICMTMPNIILQLFGSKEPAFADFAVKCMRIYLGGLFTAGFQIVSTNYFQATGQPIKASILSMLRQLIVLIPLIMILPKFFGLDGILYAGPIAEIVSTIVIAVFITIEMNKLQKIIHTEESKTVGVKSCHSAG